LGTGLLALSAVFMKTGLVVGIATLVFSACFNCFTMMTHMNACRIADCDPAGATLGEVALGKPGFYIMTVFYVVLCFFCMVSYVDVSADAMMGLVALVYPDITSFGETKFKIINWAIVLLPGTFIRSLGGIAIMSLVSFIGALSVLGLIVYRCGGWLVADGVMKHVDKLQIWPSSLSNLLAACPVLILMYALQAGGGLIIGNLKDNSKKNQTKVCCLSFFCIFLIEFVLAMIAYLWFLGNTESNVINQFPIHDPLATVGRVGVCFMVICGYVMLNVPARVMLIQLLFNKNESKQEASFMQFFTVNMCISVACLCTGIVVSDLSVVLGVTGSVATPMIAFILPSTFMIFVRAKSIDDDTEVPLFSPKNADMYISLFLGVVFWIVFCFGLGLKLCGYQLNDDWTIGKLQA
jgi:sodium-coupled neutral amino acid transporter 11